MGVKLIGYMLDRAMAKRNPHVRPAPDFHHRSDRQGVASPGAPPAAGKSRRATLHIPQAGGIKGIQYVRRTGCAWRLMPHGQTVSQAFLAWRMDGTWRRIHDRLRDTVRHPYGAPPATLSGDY